MEGTYLINTDNWFVAPDGQQYKAVWGRVKILSDSVLGVKTNSRSANWYVMVGNEDVNMIIAGCQIFYAFKCDMPSQDRTTVWDMDATNYNEGDAPSRIYIFHENH